jgi:NhaP-type Na+/H+ or K+/H+ antiporter
VELGSPVLQAVGTISLALVLFTDALGLSLREAREHRTLAHLVVGPGTLATAGLYAVAVVAAARELRSAGWERARALVGGFDAWQRAGLPTEPRSAGGGS